MEYKALKTYTDQYISIYKDQVRNISDYKLAQQLIDGGVLTLAEESNEENDILKLYAYYRSSMYSDYGIQGATYDKIIQYFNAGKLILVYFSPFEFETYPSPHIGIVIHVGSLLYTNGYNQYEKGFHVLTTRAIEDSNGSNRIKEYPIVLECFQSGRQLRSQTTKPLEHIQTST